MKKILIVIFSSVIGASCQELKSKTYTLEAAVIDQDGAPVKEATIKGSSEKIVIRDTIRQADYEPIHVKTDFEGKAKLALLRYTETPTGVLVEKDGYYTTQQPVAWPSSKQGENSTHAKCMITLKRIVNPTKMFAYSNAGSAEKIAKIKNFGVKYGFDLQYAEALPPLGKGKHADFYFTLEGEYASNSDYNMNLKIEFPNKLDGVIAFDTISRLNSREVKIQGSFLQSDYIAPENGYKQIITKKTWSSKNDLPPQNENDLKTNYYFRVRTKTDPEGRVISANYGKIYGDFFLDPANLDWGYFASLMLVDTYFNPNNNDRNVEFDTNNNLLQNSDVRLP